MKPRRIVIAGGSGHLGRILTRHFQNTGDQVIIIGRANWDLSTINHSDIVINLAGRSVNCRYTQQNRRQILDSRIDTTRAIGEAIANASHPPALWLNSSTATIYRHALDRPMDEETGELGGNEPNAPDTWNFSIDVAKAWEKTLSEANTPNTRKVALRSAMVMSATPGGPFVALATLVRLGLGGTAAKGNQYISWIHESDWLHAMDFIIENPNLDGPINLSAPNPIPNRDFMAALRKACCMPFGLPATKWMLIIGAFLIRTETELILKSRRVIPTRLLKAGFTFEYNTWSAAAASLTTSSTPGSTTLRHGFPATPPAGQSPLVRQQCAPCVGCRRPT